MTNEAGPFFLHRRIVLSIVFQDGSTLETDLSQLIKEHVCLEQLSSAKIDPDWGCLEFNEGRVDIEPKTLHRFAIKQNKDHNRC